MRRIVIVLTLILLAAGCSNEVGVDGAERQIEEAFLAPLVAPVHS